MIRDINIEQLLIKATEMLKKRPEVIFAYAFGSAILNSPVAPRDLDVAVYTNETVLNSDAMGYELELGATLERAMGYDLPLDLVVINKAPVVLRNAIFAKGRCLFSRDENLRTDLIEQTGQAAFERYPVQLVLAELMS